MDGRRCSIPLTNPRATRTCEASAATEVAFIKREDKKTPDLRAMLDSNRVLCEVKTINMSQVEADRRDRVHHGEIRAFHVPVHVTPQMLKKVSSTLSPIHRAEILASGATIRGHDRSRHRPAVASRVVEAAVQQLDARQRADPDGGLVDGILWSGQARRIPFTGPTRSGVALSFHGQNWPAL